MEQDHAPSADTLWDRPTKMLHWLLVVTVTFQLASSLFMADTATQFLYPAHEITGLIAGIGIVLFWIYAFANSDLGILLPWNRAGGIAIVHDLRGLLHGRLPRAGNQVGLSSFVHGLGLLVLSASAITGLILFTLTPLGAHAVPENALEFTRLSLYHKFLGELFWAYFIGHVAFALLHQLSGTPILGGIFNLADTSSSEAHRNDG